MYNHRQHVRGRNPRKAQDPSLDLSQQFSTVLQATLIPEKFAPYPTDSVLHLIPVQPDGIDLLGASDDSFLGGVIVAGGKQVLLYELASMESQEKQRGKQKRLETKKKGKDAVEAAKARAKELERGNRRRKPKAIVDWPWNELTACVRHILCRSLFISLWRFLVGVL